MKVKVLHANFRIDQKRELWVYIVHNIVDASSIANWSLFVPRKKDNDGMRWQLDEGNDWFCHFHEDEPDVMEINYRDGEQAEKALAGWLTLRFNVEVNYLSDKA